MRKQVTFVEERSAEGYVSQRGRFLATRSAEHCYPLKGKYPGADTAQDTSRKPQKAVHQETHFQQLCDTQQMKTVHIPKSMMAAPFLQHPSLTTGQKRYLCSIANIYSTNHMRKLMRRQYVNVLQQCMQTGHSASRENRKPGVNLPHQEKHMFDTGRETDPRSHSKPKTSRDMHRADLPTGKVIFPRIAESRHRYKSSGGPQ
ncbi:protein FAM216A isoform X2 [Amia ocellicauda]|uniref:protein FAM216A isoform X2 n=1 Tax=Amia ocellicauda TaxID=2972642 RepID=UPI003464D7CD